MCGHLNQNFWDKGYLLIFALLEGTKVDGLVRRLIQRLEPENNLELEVKGFYISVLKTYLKMGVGLFLLGVVARNQTFTLFLLLCMVVGVPAPFWDLKQKVERRTRLLQREYEEMVSKLLLYLGAGLSIRNAFDKTAQALARGEEISYLCQEMRLCLNHMKMGQLETECYYHFGKRCDLPEYLRFGGLLAQNAKKGNSELRSLLENEALDARDRQRHHRRRQGEMASTKLLGPMMLLLAMVLMMLMIPAFGSLV